MEHKAEYVGNLLNYQGAQYAGTDAVGKLCRKLEQGILQIYRDGKISLTVDVEKRAKQSLSENDKAGFIYGKYQPLPEGVFRKVGK